MSCPRLYSLEEVCELLGCDSQDWLVDRVRNGTFPARRIVRQLRFSAADIEAIIEACAVQTKRGDDGLSDDDLTPRSRRRLRALD